MANPSFDAFFWAISKQESGGNYGAVGVWVKGDRAYGKYQVMGANIPSWTKKYWGKSLTPQQFLSNSKAQEAVARGVLQGYYNKYGAKGAAAMWYSGQSNPNKTYGNPPVYKYVNSVINHASGYSGGSSTTTSTSSGVSNYSGTEVAKLASSELAEQYGFVESLMNSDAELKKLFNAAVKGQWTAQKFQAELRDTKWWKSRSSSEREFLTLKYGDPKTADQKLSQAYTQVRQLANQLGIVESPKFIKNIQAQYRTLAYNMVAKGWNESQLRDYLGKYVYFGEYEEGEGGEALQKLRSFAYDMGVTMSSTWYADRARNIVRGVGTIQDYQSAIRQQAKALYPQYSKQIDAGQTVADIASPYIQSMQSILEVPGGSLSVQDNTIKTALQNKNKATGVTEVMPLWQFENQLRNDPRWKKTQNAQNSLMQVAHQVLADFGVKY